MPLQDIWDAFLELTSEFVMPDWAVLVGMIPVGLALLVGIWLLWMAYRFATAGPTRRGKTRLAPVPPASAHMLPPSFAPVLGAIGSFMLLWGLVAGGVVLWVGAAILVVVLLYWGREALTDYEHTEPVIQTLPAVIDTPPPGVHLPGPSFRPVLGALASAALLFGLVFGGWILVVGVAFLVVALIGWLRDARAEFVKTIEADETGHLENIPAPSYPRTIFAVFGLAILLASVVTFGIVSTGDGGEAPGSPPPGGPTAGPGEPTAAPPDEPEADVVIHAVGIAFLEKTFTAPADTAFTIALVNEDAGVPHDIEIRGEDGAPLWRTEIFNGIETRIYTADPLPAGEYVYICTIHPIPAMTGTATIGP